MSEVKNPCINICRTDSKGICLGCRRSLEEIGDWSKYSQFEKTAVLEKIKQRRNEVEDYYGGFSF
ncbi:MAG TPA: DUF1289 domain-containing protein [Bacteroidales bacterium]|jgi:predicted Fe-S protein YdhL (DUF1289 family)|nr:DUF1289 domain-containing protein [Bacteroidales bacterium]